MLSYPLHAAGKPDQPRAEHFPGIRVPVLFVSGTRDSHGGAGRSDHGRPRPSAGRSSFHWIETADHGYRPLKASGRTTADVAGRGGGDVRPSGWPGSPVDAGLNGV